jgi:heterokaryon incompatibility protein (HET)
LDLAERWLEECCESHLRKCQKVNTDFIPTRLIDVGRELKRDSVKLVSLQKSDDPDDSTSTKYAALSYCWGTTPFLTTTSLNFKDMYNLIPLSRLPATIRDAIKIVRHLKIRYLWTDSLCILQGSDEAARKDWLAESSKMGQIYESAHFTISAESAPSAVTGILHHRPTQSVDFFPIPASIEDLDVVYLGSFQTREPERTEPLHFRGWTLQETILSSRLLRFGTREISWRCRTGEKRETRCHEEQRTDHDNGIKEMDIKDKIAHDIYSKWQSIVEDYSRRTLTKSSDKLPAIAGLAEVAQRTSRDLYAAGVWISDIPHGLLWMHERRKQAYVRKDKFQAPTWSWASVEGPIRHLHDYIPVKRLAIEFRSPEYHAAKACSTKYELVIRGLVKQLSTLRCHEFGAYYGGYDNFLPWMNLPSSLETYLDDLNDIPLKHKKGGMEHPIELVNTSFLILAKTRNKRLVAGLIIIPVEKTPRCFRRIGMFKGLPLTEVEAKELEVEAKELDAESLKIIRIARALYRERKLPISVTTIRLI